MWPDVSGGEIVKKVRDHGPRSDVVPSASRRVPRRGPVWLRNGKLPTAGIHSTRPTRRTPSCWGAKLKDGPSCRARRSEWRQHSDGRRSSWRWTVAPQRPNKHGDTMLPSSHPIQSKTNTHHRRTDTETETQPDSPVVETWVDMKRLIDKETGSSQEHVVADCHLYDRFEQTGTAPWVKKLRTRGIWKGGPRRKVQRIHCGRT